MVGVAVKALLRKHGAGDRIGPAAKPALVVAVTVETVAPLFPGRL